jgi:hypothetical protein
MSLHLVAEKSGYYNHNKYEQESGEDKHNTCAAAAYTVTRIH